MAVWLVRLGAKEKPDNRALYQDFARNHDIIKIGFGIRDDITDYDDKDDIKDYLRDNNLYDGTEQSLGQRAGVIYSLQKRMKLDDIVICDFDDISGDGSVKYRIGIVESGCDTTESFFIGRENELDTIIANHPNSDEQGYIKPKPARRVKWITGDIDFEDLDSYFQDKIAKAPALTISKLRNSIS